MMGLDLDKRHRAMLREMGIRVWQPMGAPAPAADIAAPELPAVHVVSVTAAPATPITINSIAEGASFTGAAGTIVPKMGPVSPKVSPPPAATAEPRLESSLASWTAGQPLALYADAPPEAGPRWLVLAETPAAALKAEPYNPFDGDAGKLLDNMLRAARLNHAGRVMLAPLVRRVATGGSSDANLVDLLPGLLAEARPDVVLVMGRLAAQALLQSSEPFGKLRGQVHSLQGVQTIVTIDAPYLLRNQGDKARAWDDLCLALSVA